MGRIVQITLDAVFSLAGAGLLLWLSWRAFDKSDNRLALVIRWLFTALVLCVIIKVAAPEMANGGLAAIFGLIVTLLCGMVLAILWAGSVTDLFAKPFAALFDGGDIPPEPKPLYSAAISRRKRNRPLEAVIAIREQLAKFPNDYEGTLLLANIQAEDLKDLPSAEMTLNHFCEWEKAPPKQVAAALTQMADWYLKFFQDAASARAALERIAEKYPETDLALLAKQRIAHLSGTEKTQVEAQSRGPVIMPEGVRNVGLLESSAHLARKETPPEELAVAYAKQLAEHPDDTEAREKLAILYVRHYQRLDLATLELRQMIDEPNHPPKRKAHWLNLLADLQVSGGADYETVKATLEKIVEDFPDFAVAEVARSRLALLKLEFKALEKAPDKTMGDYE